jgi:hypothetical protein
MPFFRMKGIKGLVYAPTAGRNLKKKHPCRDCLVCHWCSAARCLKCRGQGHAARPAAPRR